MLRAATPVATHDPHRRPSPRCAWLALALLLPHSARAADKPVEGLIVQVPTTITTESTGRLRSLLHGPLSRFEQGAARQGGRFVLLCDFNPEGRRAESDDFGASYGLATYLRSLQNVRTVAYVEPPGPIAPTGRNRS
ncbi:MAG: hypothetical protein U0797_29905 [Gemmataceae bacterium]